MQVFRKHFKFLWLSLMIDSHVHRTHRVKRSGEVDLNYILIKMSIVFQDLIGRWAQTLDDCVIKMCKGLMTL